jgi:hypothetical protein
MLAKPQDCRVWQWSLNSDIECRDVIPVLTGASVWRSLLSFQSPQSKIDPILSVRLPSSASATPKQ